MKRTRIKSILAINNRYEQYQRLETWLEEVYVHVVEVREIDEDTLVVLYENA